MVSINSRKASNVSKLDSSLDPRSFRELRIENRVSSIELQGTVNLPLSGTVCILTCFFYATMIVTKSGVLNKVKLKLTTLVLREKVSK